MRGFPSRGRSHIENTLVGLRGESNDRKKGGGGLEHVVAGEVFGCGACNGVRVQTRHVGALDLPIGTLLSKTRRPTFVHLPMGSRLTPRLIRA